MILVRVNLLKEQNVATSQGDSDKLLIRTSKMKMPMDLKTFLNNGRNKERLFELF